MPTETARDGDLLPTLRKDECMRRCKVGDTEIVRPARECAGFEIFEKDSSRFPILLLPVREREVNGGVARPLRNATPLQRGISVYPAL